MKRTILAAFAALAAFASIAAPDDSAVANRKWVREYIGANAVKARPAITSVGGSVTCASSLPGTNGMDLAITVRVPTNEALFVAWSTEGRIPSFCHYAKVPGMALYQNVSNAFLPSISFSVTNWVEYGTNELGEVRTCRHTSTRWTATAANGERWSTAYMNGNTVLCCSTNTARYIVIQRSTVSDRAASALLGPWGVAWSHPAAPPSLLSLLVQAAFAEDHHVEVERFGGTLGYHEAVEVSDFTVTDRKKTYNYRLIDDGENHQYDPYGGIDHADLAAGEAYYRSPSMLADPEKWGYSFPLLVEVLDKNGNPTGKTVYINKEDLMASDAWIDAVNVALPKPNEPDEPAISDPSEHDCGVFDREGNHIGCVCDYRFCKYCPRCAGEYEITKSWSDGTVERTKKTLSFVGAVHNMQGVQLNGDGKFYADEGGCSICWAGDNAENGTHFCGNADLNNIGGKALSQHLANDLAKTVREECGCMCGKYGDGYIVPSNMHVHPASESEGHGPHHGQDTYCWCFCRREHSGAYGKDGCPNNCLLCGAFKTCDGVEINGLHADPVPYRVTDDGGLPDINDHEPSETRCGCKCGAIAEDNEQTYPLMKEDESFHAIEDGTCTCQCRRRMHKVHNETGHCTAICTLCGKKNGKAEDGWGNLVITAVTPTWEDHTHMTGHCGCECRFHQDGFVGVEGGLCGYAGAEPGPSDEPSWHERRGDGFCCCACGVYSSHAAKGGAHAAWFIAGEHCPAVCRGRNSFGQECGMVVNVERRAIWSEHTPKADGCGCACGAFTGLENGMRGAYEYHHGSSGPSGCFCLCGAFHHGYDGETAANRCKVCSRCGLTAVGADGSDESLHKLNEGAGDCQCWCEYYKRGKRTAKGEALHAPLTTEKNGVRDCSCRCGLSVCHFFREGNACQGICAFCRERDVNGRKVRPSEHEAFGQDDHPIRCGCKCGGVLADDAKGAELNIFHYRKPGTCVCLGGDGNGGTHHFVDRNADCPGICAYRHNGLRHKAADYDHQIMDIDLIKDDGRPTALNWHTTKSAGDGCGCACGAYHDGNTGEWATFMPGWHRNNPALCGCWCRDAFGFNVKDWHVWGDGCHCLCDLKWHRPVKSDECPGICKSCFGLVFGEKGLTTEASRLLHAPAEGRCGCACGHFAGHDYATSGLETAFHSVHEHDCWDVCDDGCGKVRNHTRFDLNACGICRMCGLTRDGQEKLEHDFDPSSCICKCGDEERDHVMKRVGEAMTSSEHCDICGVDIEHKEFTWQCERCGFTEVSTATVGKHGPHEDHGQPDNQYFCESCSCNCTAGKNGDPCDACVNHVGACANCGRSCGELTGGDTGGGLPGEGENNVDPWHID